MNKLLIGDGGMGTELRMRGVNVPSHEDSIWSALALIENIQIIKEIHLDFIEAGAEFIIANNYAVTQPILERENLSHMLEDLTLRSIEIAKEAIKESGKQVLLAASLPPLETSYRSDLILERTSMDHMYGELASILENKVDIVICETMSHSLEAMSALTSIQNLKSQKWMAWTIYGNQNTLPSGETITEAFDVISDLECDAYLINCGGANLITEGIKELKPLTNKPIGGYGNSEIIEISKKDRSDRPEVDHWSSATAINEKEYAEEAQIWVQEGATIIAGCCRTRPSHIEEISKILKN
jgi:S-methylmethionine-dependent homocysteine/selenocysteine methylase